MTEMDALRLEWLKKKGYRIYPGIISYLCCPPVDVRAEYPLVKGEHLDKFIGHPMSIALLHKRRNDYSPHQLRDVVDALMMGLPVE